jgi:hypothetical protein
LLSPGWLTTTLFAADATVVVVISAIIVAEIRFLNILFSFYFVFVYTYFIAQELLVVNR